MALPASPKAKFKYKGGNHFLVPENSEQKIYHTNTYSNPHFAISFI
jgi:hypothetical protein